MNSNIGKTVMLCAVNLMISTFILIKVAEASHNDIMWELFNTKSATNFSSKHLLHDNLYFLSKNNANSNAITSSSVTSGQVIVTPETGKKQKLGGGANLLIRCFSHYGCFSIAEPFLSLYRPINLFPISPDVLNVAFLLKTRKNPEQFQKIIRRDDGSFEAFKFNPKNELKIIIHGYLEHGFQSWIKNMCIELLSKNDYNIISVDWMIGATPPYTQAVANARLVGAIIAEFLKSIQKLYSGYSASKIHIIGHSLGAHIAGYVGERIPGLGRITGLDPAEPYFQNTDPRVRLDSSDASFVDVIHTDASSIITGGFGMSQGCGHVDFYPNGGAKQPGCNEGAFKSVIDSIGKERNVIHGIRRFIGCSHIRAHMLFTESINTECPFMGFSCSTYEEFSSGRCSQNKNACLLTNKISDHNNNNTSDSNEYLQCLRMGFEADLSWRLFINRDSNKIGVKPSKSAIASSSTAMYFLQTSDQNPYCQNHYHIKIYFESRNAEMTANNFEKGRLFIQIVGTKSSTNFLEATKETLQLGSSESIQFLISWHNVGTVLRVELVWKAVSSSSLRINPLRWRLLESPKIYLHQIWITHLETGYRTIICGEETALKSQQTKILFTKQC